MFLYPFLFGIISGITMRNTQSELNKCIFYFLYAVITFHYPSFIIFMFMILLLSYRYSDLFWNCLLCIVFISYIVNINKLADKANIEVEPILNYIIGYLVYLNIYFWCLS